MRASESFEKTENFSKIIIQTLVKHTKVHFQGVRDNGRMAKRRRKIRPATLAAAIEYKARNELLVELGYKDYYAYLKTRLWKGIRDSVLSLSDECYGCGAAKVNQVHHGRYDRETLLGEDLTRLFPICGRCHLQIEFQEGRKTSPSEATVILERMHERMEMAKAAGFYRAPTEKRKTRKKRIWVSKWR